MKSAGLETVRKSGNLYATVDNSVPIVPVVAKIKVKTSRPSLSEIQRAQYPLALACTCTIHKVQGLIPSTVVFSLKLYKQKQLNYGQVYVALSRVKSLEQLYIIGELIQNTSELIQGCTKNTKDIDLEIYKLAFQI